MVPVATGMANCYENRRQTHTVIPAKAGIHRDEGPAIFISLMWPDKAIVIPTAHSHSEHPLCHSVRSEESKTLNPLTPYTLSLTPYPLTSVRHRRYPIFYRQYIGTPNLGHFK